ncbi:saccharopine dehydrogenase NADP-binding domain-containing protein [Alkalicoccobacillus gibsonii]|uniref:saccharopine dehydrogenase NADP-binding domain-containing protein n=1 Tax=Alkalicoccobacillus gibsonii TaxID=79881 RepID=UPI0035194881
MRSNIVVVGGYGKVGRMICEHLANKYPGKVYAAGRNHHKAEEFSKAMHSQVLPLAFDVSTDEEPAWLSDARIVVVCLDLANDRFASMCLEEGIQYVDITANEHYIYKMKALSKYSNLGTGVVSVGLAPGLTNLLAQQAVNMEQNISQIDISIMLGSGEKHGPAAVDWTLENMVHAFIHKKMVHFNSSIGTRATYQFPFSDQYTLPTTLHVPEVTTRLCFDSSAFTHMIALLRFLKITKVMKSKNVRKVVTRLLEQSKIGTDAFAIKVDAYTPSGVIELSLNGSNQTKITAIVTSLITLALYENNLPAGVFHIEELFELVTFSDTNVVIKLKEVDMNYSIDL